MGDQKNKGVKHINASHELVGVLFPGVVKNDDKALECLGGIRTISQTYSNSQKMRLGLSFRPDNPHIKKAFGDIKKTFGVLIKVKVKKTVQGFEVKREVASTSIVGRINKMYQFNSLSDFQFLPIDTDVQPARCLIDVILPSGLDSLNKYLNSPEKPFLVPPSFSRSDKALCYAYTDKKEEQQTTSDNIHYKVREHRKCHATQSTFTLTNLLPTEPNEYYAKHLSKATPKFMKMYEHLKQLFEERPIWSRNAVQYKTKYKLTDLKLLLPCVGFITKNGPWKLLWIKYGYDPRKDPEARKYQCLDFRLRQDAYLKSLVAKYTTRTYKRKVGDVKKPLVRGVLLEEGSDKEQEATEVTVCYRPGMIPTQRQIYYQYCDVKLPEIEEMISQSPSPGAQCHAVRGWLAPGTNEKCREILTKYAREALLAAPKDAQSDSSSGTNAANPDEPSTKQDCEPSTSFKFP